jgi:molybdopterin-containing oxidoreductase family iron-sulfur binding subunit
VPACAQACPTQAIVFGDINDKGSKVANLKAQARDYSLLEDLNTRPRTTYLGRLRNPNPEIEKG